MRIEGKEYRSVWWDNDKVKMIDQSRLPHKIELIEFSDYKDVAQAIKNMAVRGAPSIGAAAAFAMALADINGVDLQEAARVVRNTRPTAQDLFYGISMVLNAHEKGENSVLAACNVANRYVNACEKIGEFGSELIEDGMKLNTHCNAGWLAAVDWGTALAPIYKANHQNKKVFVYVDETRPRCQGGRLTAFELSQENIDNTIITDSAAGHFMMRGEIDMILVGSDRIAANGDIANKIGTYSSAVVAYENNIPFYVAAPMATIDPDCATGIDIPIEQRHASEVTHMFGYDENSESISTVRIAPKNHLAFNPAFDVTPGKFISGIITEAGIFKPEEISKLIQSNEFKNNHNILNKFKTSKV